MTLDSEPGSLLRARAPVTGPTLPGGCPSSLPVTLWEVKGKVQVPPLARVCPSAQPFEVPQAAFVSLSLPLQQNPAGTRRRRRQSKAPWRRVHTGFSAPRLGRWLLGAGRGGLGCSGSVSEGRSAATTGDEK